MGFGGAGACAVWGMCGATAAQRGPCPDAACPARCDHYEPMHTSPPPSIHITGSISVAALPRRAGTAKAVEAAAAARPVPHTTIMCTTTVRPREQLEQ